MIPAEHSSQEVFDFVANHLWTQGRPAKTKGRCVYRAENGDMRAVGCLIPDKLYRKDFDEVLTPVVDLMESSPELLRHLGPYQGLLVGLQEVHDDCPTQYHASKDFDHRQLDEMLSSVASAFGLTYTPRATSSQT